MSLSGDAFKDERTDTADQPADETECTPQASLRDAENDGWWRQPCGGREMLRLALPLMISTMSISLVHFTDRMFLMWHSSVSMAASMPAAMANFAMLCLPLGVVMYVNTFVAQYLGAGRPHRVGLSVFQGARVALLFTPLFLLSIWIAPALFEATGHAPAVVAEETLYFQILAFAAGPTLLGGAFCTFFTGRGDTRTVMWVDGSASLVNVVLDYWWIFGGLGLPAYGIEGAGWATVASQVWRMGLFWRLMHRGENVATYGLVAGRRFDRDLFRRLMRYGMPSGVQMVIEMSGVTLFIFLVGKLGEDAMVVTTMAFNINALAFMPMLGLGIAVSTIVGQQLGHNRPNLAARATWAALRLALIYCAVMTVVYLAVPHWILASYAVNNSPERFAELSATATMLLRFVAAYCLFDAMLVVFVSAIKGAGDTRFVLWVSVVTAPLPVLVGVAGIEWFGLGLMWCWWILTVWIVALSLTYLWRFWQGKWRDMRVIEQTPVDPPCEEDPLGEQEAAPALI